MMLAAPRGGGGGGRGGGGGFRHRGGGWSWRTNWGPRPASVEYVEPVVVAPPPVCYAEGESRLPCQGEWITRETGEVCCVWPGLQGALGAGVYRRPCVKADPAERLHEQLPFCSGHWQKSVWDPSVICCKHDPSLGAGPTTFGAGLLLGGIAAAAAIGLHSALKR